MDHHKIDQDDVVERYLQGRLGGEEASAFEAHLLECGECFEKVRWSEDFGHGMRVAAAQDVAKATTAASMMAWLSRAGRGRVLLLGLSAVLLLAPSLLYLLEINQPRASATSQVNTPIFALGATRDGTTQQISLGEIPEWIVLTVALPVVEHESYGAILFDATGEEAWRGEGLVPDAADRLVLSFYSTLLQPSTYNLQVIGAGEGASDALETFEFKVVR